ncbi:MAG: tRNA preQ1(34) S-adenosylmethionine ribosyltransferase-isomerase QueA [Gammaproteobacteria bacterium]|nr:tRNA preQ1(34) S-adenosylmethionine ribosyltransferase-isomerase QueA [Gammaproteobacteria bacterium]
MRLDDFNYQLPEELIARYPLPQRSSSRLLCLNKQNGFVSHKKFTDLIDFLLPNDLLVFNDTRVIPARLFGFKQTGGRVEVLVERLLDSRRVLAHIRASKSPRLGSLLFFCENAISFEVTQRQNDLFELLLRNDLPGDNKQSVMHVLNAIGEIPIPPYFDRAPDENDKQRYQTIYAKHNGSVAAPTAGLHFDEAMFSTLRDKNIGIGYVTLHVGAGTFAPVRVEDITQHHMHAEFIHVSKELCEQIQKTQSSGGRVIAVGTTSARSLETASQQGFIQPYLGDTNIFIYPGYQFQCIDALFTNFHLPCSTLLMLVSALAGYENTMEAYRVAVNERYRFFSYGDAMLIV